MLGFKWIFTTISMNLCNCLDKTVITIFMNNYNLWDKPLQHWWSLILIFDDKPLQSCIDWCKKKINKKSCGNWKKKEQEKQIRKN